VYADEETKFFVDRELGIFLYGEEENCEDAQIAVDRQVVEKFHQISHSVTFFGK
jgi:hypothetical protein